jgi:cyclin H
LQTSEREQARKAYLTQFTATKPDITADEDLISPLEEAGLLRLYQDKIVAVSVNLKLPRKVLSTSINFLKRFYIRKSSFEYDPQQMVLVCLYVACKVEDCYISAAELGRLVGVPADLLLKLELVLLQGVDFDLQVHSLYRAVEGCLLDFTEWREKAATNNETTIPVEKLDDIKAAANLAADRLLLSDAPLLFTPGQIGLSALHSGVRKVENEGQSSEFEKYLKHVGKDHGGGGEGTAVVELMKTIEAVERIVNEAGESLQHEEVVGIDKKLKSFRKKMAALGAGKSKKNKG